MITRETYVTYEVAVLLKQNDFDGETFKHYHGYNPGCEYLTSGLYNPEYDTIAPTQQTALKWLRDVHGLAIEISVNYDMNVDMNSKIDAALAQISNEGFTSFSGYGFTIHRLNPHAIIYEDTNDYKIYEDAVENALRLCLKNLKEFKK